MSAAPPRDDATANPPESFVQGQMQLVEEPPFEDPAALRATWGEGFGVADEVGRLRRVLVRPPGEEFAAMRAEDWDERVGALYDPGRYFWGDRTPPDRERLAAQHAGLVAALEAEGIEVVKAPALPERHSKAIYIRDPLVMLPCGAVVGRLAAQMRRGEEPHVTRMLAELGVPILRTIVGRGTLEGGSIMRLRPDVVALGTSIRCNAEGAAQLAETLGALGGELVTVPLGGYSIHIDGHLALVDVDKALVHAPGLPYELLQRLKALGYELLHIDAHEGWAINLLTLRPGRVLMSDECPRTAELLERRGVEVVPLAYDEVHKNGGGIHCSTHELWREPAS